MMLKLLDKVMARGIHTPKQGGTLRSVRPSVLDLRFTGDPWVVDHKDGSASVRLDNYRLARIETVPIDVPSLNQLLLQLRLWQMRRRYYRHLRNRASCQVASRPASVVVAQPIQ